MSDLPQFCGKENALPFRSLILNFIIMKTTFLKLTACMMAVALASCEPKIVHEDSGAGAEQGIFQISLADANIMTDKYVSERQRIINSHPDLVKLYGRGFEDTRNVWYSLPALKAFIAKIESDAAKNNSAVDVDGLRIYLGVYPERTADESEFFRTVKDSYRNHLTLFMIPTYYDSITRQSYDFDPASFDSDAAPSQLKSLGNPEEDTETRITFNHGTLCPPMCPIIYVPTPTIAPTPTNNPTPGGGGSN
jgi:hypothetical protein